MEWRIRDVVAIEVAAAAGLVMQCVMVVEGHDLHREAIKHGQASAIVMSAGGACALRSVHFTENGYTEVEADYTYPSHDENKLPASLKISMIGSGRSPSQIDTKGGPGSVTVHGSVMTGLLLPKITPPFAPGAVTLQERSGQTHLCGGFFITPFVPPSIRPLENGV